VDFVVGEWISWISLFRQWISLIRQWISWQWLQGFRGFREFLFLGRPQIERHVRQYHESPHHITHRTHRTASRRARRIYYYARQHNMLERVYAIARPSLRPSVRLSVTQVDHTKTVEVRIMKLSPYGSTIRLVFPQQVSSRNSDGFPQSGSVKWGWGR